VDGGRAHAAPPSPAAAPAVHSTFFSAAQQSAALSFWTPERLRAAQDVTTLPASIGAMGAAGTAGGTATASAPDAAGPEVTVPAGRRAGHARRG